MADVKEQQKQKARLGKKELYDELYDKESIEKSKTTLATGGGEPIKKGHKRTNEKRVLQPRDPKTGQFDYNASADIERKYDYHAERNGLHGNAKEGYTWSEQDRHVPVNLQKAKAAFFQAAPEGKLEKGQIMSVNGQKFIAPVDMTETEFMNAITDVYHDAGGKASLGDAMVSATTSGAKKEHAGESILKDEGLLKSIDREEFEQLVLSSKGGKQHNAKYFAPAAEGLSDEKKAANEEWNAKKQAPAPAPAPAPKEETPVEPKKEETKAPFKFDHKEAEKNPKAYYEAHKADIDKAVKKLNEKKGTHINAAQYVDAKIKMMKAKEQGNA